MAARRPGPSEPQRGPVEASFAGALGVRLGGVNTYSGRVESRAVLGDGRPVAQDGIARARVLGGRVDLAAVALSAILAAAASRPPGRQPLPDR